MCMKSKLIRANIVNRLYMWFMNLIIVSMICKSCIQNIIYCRLDRIALIPGVCFRLSCLLITR